MKKLLLLFLFCPLFLCAKDYSIQSDSYAKMLVELKKVTRIHEARGPGFYITQAGRSYQTGIALSVIGSGVAVLGANADETGLVILGGATALTGFIFTIVGHTKLVKAGKLLDKELTLSPSSSGLGLALNF